MQIRRGDIETEYTVAAISNSTINMGNFLFLSPYDLPFPNITGYNMVLADGNNPRELQYQLDIAFPDRTMNINTVEDMIREDENNNSSIVKLYFMFSIFVILIGVQGIYNNFKLSYLNRRKVFAIMLSNGYRLKDITHILIGETLVCGLLGGILAILYQLFYRQKIIHIMSLMNIALPLRQNLWNMMLPVILCIGVSLISIGGTYRGLRK